MFEIIGNFLGNPSGMIIVATVMVIAFARCITKIFRMGVDFKSDLATKSDQREFEEEIRRDMRGYASQIQKSVTESVMLVMNNRLKDIEDAKKAADEIRITKAEIDLQLKNLNEKTDSLKSVADEVRVLSNKMQRLEYSQTTGNLIAKQDRRSE